MELHSLPSPRSTNGTWINVQAHHNLILGMITWNRKWGSRYGVLPGAEMCISLARSTTHAHINV